MELLWISDHYWPEQDAAAALTNPLKGGRLEDLHLFSQLRSLWIECRRNATVSHWQCVVSANNGSAWTGLRALTLSLKRGWKKKKKKTPQPEDACGLNRWRPEPIWVGMVDSSATGCDCWFYRHKVRIHCTGARQLGCPGDRTQSPCCGMQPLPRMQMNKSVNVMQNHLPSPLMIIHLHSPKDFSCGLRLE